MEIKEFGQLLSEEIMSALGDGCRASYNEVEKNNGTIHHAITIKREGINLAPNIYIDGHFQEYKDGRSLASIVGTILSVYRMNEGAVDFDVESFTDFARASENLCFKLVNYEKNKNILRDVPYKRFCDLALVPLCNIDSSSIGRGNIVIRSEHLKTWEISKEELWENVFEHTQGVMPVSKEGLLDFVRKNASFVTTDEGEEFGNMIYILSNSDKCLGAGVILYPGVLEEIAKEYENDVFIIPSSIHEVIALPATDDGDFGFLQKMIREVNRSTVSEEEILSDNLYIYHADTGKINICA